MKALIREWWRPVLWFVALLTLAFSWDHAFAVENVSNQTEVTPLDAIIGSLVTLGLNLFLVTLYALVVLVGFRRWTPLQRLVAEFIDEIRDAAKILRQELHVALIERRTELSLTALVILAVIGLISASTLLGLFLLVSAVLLA